MNKDESHNGMTKAHCPRCDYFLATIHDGEVSIRIKENFCYFRGGLARLICSGCAAEVYIVDESYENSHPDMIERLKGKMNVYRAKIEPWVSRKKFKKN